MNNQLLLFFGSDSDQPIHWIAQGDTDDTENSPTPSHLAKQGSITNAQALHELTELAAQYPCTVIVSLDNVTLLSAQLPNQSKEALAAIPYQLEDQLCDDIEQLHFALGPLQADNSNPVAVVAKQQMECWLQWLAQANIHPQSIVPQTLKIDAEAEFRPVLHWGNRLILQTGTYNAFSIEAGNFSTWWQLAQDYINAPAANTEQSDNPQPNVKPLQRLIPVPAGLTDSINEQQDFQALPFEHQQEVSISKVFNTESAINLLQGAYRPENPMQSMLKLWRWPAALAFILMLLYPAALYWQNLQLAEHKAQLTVQINQLYQTTFPDSKRIVNVRSQTEYRLKQLQQGNQGSVILSTLAAIAPALITNAKLEIKTLNFDRSKSKLKIQLKAPSQAALDQVEQTLTASKLSYEIESVRRQGQQFNALLVITTGK